MRHYRRIFSCVIICFLFFSLTDASQVFASKTSSSTNCYSASAIEKKSAKAATKKVVPKAVTKKSGIYKFRVVQKKANVRSLRCTVYNYNKLKKKKIKKISVSVLMVHGGKIWQRANKTVTMKKLRKNKKFRIVVPQYGKYRVIVRYYNDENTVIKRLILYRVGVIAKKYNIAVLNGTYAPLLFSLMLWDKNVSRYKGKAVPTYVTLTRYNTFNWKRLPKNVYLNPLAKSAKNDGYWKKMAAYVKQLHEMNPNSRFHFFVTDNGMHNIFELAYKNGIKDSRCDVTIITDGQGSYKWFNRTFNVKGSNPNAINATMVAELKTLQKKCLAGKRVSYEALKYSYTNPDYPGRVLARYAYSMAAIHKNYRYIVARTDGTFQSVNSSFLTRAKKQMTVVSLTNKLQSVKKAGHLKQVKSLLKFNENIFKAASAEKKKVFIIMGGRVGQEDYFDEFVYFLKKYYGNGYKYYYKGHPGTPTAVHPVKQKQLKRLGLIDIDSMIPAELILYFKPNVFIAGCSDSTLNSAYKKKYAKAYLNLRISKRNTINNGSVFDLFFSKINQKSEKEIIQLCQNDDPKLKNSYLIEYSADSDKFGIFNSATKKYTVYSWKAVKSNYNNTDDNNNDNNNDNTNSEDVVPPVDNTDNTDGTDINGDEDATLSPPEEGTTTTEDPDNNTTDNNESDNGETLPETTEEGTEQHL